MMRVGGVGLVVLVLAACGSTSAKPLGAAPTDPSSSAVSTSTSTTANGPTTTSVESTKAAILAAYRGAWADIDAVEGHYPIDVFDVRLSNHMAGKQLGQVRTAATALKFQGQYLAGPPSDTSGAIVKELVGAAAVVADCNVDPTVLMDGRTNQVVKAASTDRVLRNAKVELIGGAWKMTEFTNVGVTCTVAH
jgi:hypothetical protein